MTYQDLYEKATRLLDNGEITIGEYEEMIKPLKREICGWIPVSDGLPSDNGNYLITVADLRLGHNGEHTVTMADFYAKAKKWNSVVDVVAWMPLPPVYQGE